MYVCIYECMYVCVCMYVCMCVYVCMYVHCMCVVCDAVTLHKVHVVSPRGIPILRTGIPEEGVSQRLARTRTKLISGVIEVDMSNLFLPHTCSAMESACSPLETRACAWELAGNGTTPWP